jgi:hypothetical protein
LTRRVQLTAQRPGRISGLATHFDVAWGCRGQVQALAGQVPTFSTAPTAPSTSWLQTIFSFPKPLATEAAQTLGVELTVSPVGLPVGRMLEVAVEVEFGGLRARVPYQLKR